MRKMRYAHPLKGVYVRPEIIITSISGNPDLYPSCKLTKYALMINAGNQFVFSDRFLLDLYAGCGYGKNNDFEGSPAPYVFKTIGGGNPLSFTFGFRVGWLLPYGHSKGMKTNR